VPGDGQRYLLQPMVNETYLVSESLNRIPTSELDLVSTILGHEPVGYVDYLHQFGTGTYCDFLRIASPIGWLADLTDEFREIEPQYLEWFPNYGVGTLPRFDDAHCIGRTIDGDYLVSKPGFPIHVLPRHDDSLYVLNDGLRDPLAWTRCDKPSRNYVYQPPFRYFESDRDRNIMSLFTAGIHEIDEVRKLIADNLPPGPIRHITVETDDGAAASIIRMFPRVIQGRIELSQSQGDTRVGIMLSFDAYCDDSVETLVVHLERRGFYVTSKS